MRNLLDTHTLIWFLNGEIELSDNARKAIERPNALNLVSVASLWEIAVKVGLGKLELQMPLAQIPSKIAANGFRILPIAVEDALLVAGLPPHHRDPFDRIIICQGINNQLTILSKDAMFRLCDVVTLW